MSLRSPVASPVQSVEINGWVRGEFRPSGLGIPPGEGAEEGVDQDDHDLLLGQRDAVCRASREEREGAGEDVRGGDEDVHHARDGVVKEGLSLLWLELLSEKCVKS